MSRFTPRTPPGTARPMFVLVAGLAILVAGCSGTPSLPIAEPVTTTETTPRQVSEVETTSTTTTTTTTTTIPEPAPGVSVSILGSIRTLPSNAPEDAVADADADEDPSAPILDGDDATVASLGCSSSSGCEPTELAAWAANRLDAVNLATSAAAVDGVDVLDEYATALLASGVTTVGYGTTLTQALEPVIVGTAERPVALFSISLDDELDPETAASDSTAGIAAGADALDLLLEQIEQSQEAEHRVIVMIDFGVLETRAPLANELANVQTVAAANADVIVGHGSDFLQRFERIEQSAVAFNLGNAVIETDAQLRRDSAIFSVNFDENGPITCLLPATGSAEGISIDDPTTLDCPQ